MSVLDPRAGIEPEPTVDRPSPISGHRPPPLATRPLADEPEHDWAAARSRIFPLLRPVGTRGTSLAGLDLGSLAGAGTSPHAQPVLDDGPAGIPIAYVIREGSFDVIVSADHLLDWGVQPDDLRRAAYDNLTAWSAGAPWTDEASGQRRIISSVTGEGADAARILLEDARGRLDAELGPAGRVLVGLPGRDLLVGGTLLEADPEFAALFAEFLREEWAAADEPIDPRVLELVDGEIHAFAG